MDAETFDYLVRHLSDVAPEALASVVAGAVVANNPELAPLQPVIQSRVLALLTSVGASKPSWPRRNG